jgi:hypothetical protein
MPDELDTARLRFPVGSTVRGRFSAMLRPGAIGMFVDLGEPPQGFVDVLLLPASPADWPSIGTEASFEILRHRYGQVRLWPLDPVHRHVKEPRFAPAEPEWEILKARYPVAGVVTAQVTGVYPSERAYLVEFGDHYASLGWTGNPPTLGSTADYRVTKHLDTTRRMLLTPVSGPSRPA